VAATAVILGLASLSAWWLRSAPQHFSIRSEIGLTPPMGGGMSSLRLLDGGTRFAYVAQDSNLLHLRDLGQVESTPITGTEDGQLGDTSPDGKWLAFFSGTSLRKVPIDGGVSQELTTVAENPRGASWGSDGYVYYAPSSGSEIWRVPESGGQGERVTQLPDAGQSTGSRINSHRWPTTLPGDRGLIYTAGTSGTFADARIELLEFATGETRVLQQQALFSHYIPDGYLTFIHRGALTVVDFDAESMTVTSAPGVVVEGVEHYFGNAGAQYSVSADGTLLYRPGQGSQIDIEMQLVGHDGQPTTVRGPTALFHPRYSPDGARIAFSEGFGVTSDIWVHDVAKNVATRLTFDLDAADIVPIWGPDGKWITFSSDRDGDVANLFRKRADGSGDIQRLTTSDRAQHPCHWSSDGRRLLYTQRHEAYSFELMQQEFDDNGTAVGEAVPVIRDIATSSSHGVFSPDDRFIAYEIRERDTDQIFVTTAEGKGRWQVSTDSGRTPRWSRDGRRLYFHREGDNGPEIAFVDIATEGGSPGVGHAQTYVSMPISKIQAISASFDVHPDEHQLIVMAAMWTLRDASNPILIQDWVSELP